MVKLDGGVFLRKYDISKKFLKLIFSFFVEGLFIPKLFMYLCPMYSKELLKGTLKTIILKLLSENEKMYGYEITQKVKQLSNDKVVITEGALYPSLHKLEAEGLLQTETVNIGKRVRKYYSLTPQGTSTVRTKVEEFTEFVETMQSLLSLKATTT